jgi:hypothetical protein
MKSSVFASDRPQGPGMRLPPGVYHISEIIPFVLTGYGLSIEDSSDVERHAPAAQASDLFDVSIAALEAVLAG